MIPQNLYTDRLVLAPLDPDRLGNRYREWLNDPGINRFLEIRFHAQTDESVRAFVRETNASAHSILFGIFLPDGHRHIGNIKIGPIDPYHARADIGLLLGEREHWGKGFATEAIQAITAYGFDTLKLNKVMAGCYSANDASRRAFLRAGFREIGRRKNHARTNSGWMDDVLLERNNPNPPQA